LAVIVRVRRAVRKKGSDRLPARFLNVNEDAAVL